MSTQQHTKLADRPEIPFDATTIQSIKAKQGTKKDHTKTAWITLAVWRLPLVGYGLWLIRGALRRGFPVRMSLGALRALANPWFLGLYLTALPAVAYAVHTHRHRHDVVPVTLPPFPPEPDLRHRDDLLLGRGWTWDGAGPGTVVPSDTECYDDPHLTIPPIGQFGNLHVIGATGSGKTERMIKPLLIQIITKHPKPEKPRWLLEEEAAARPVAAAELAAEAKKDAMQHRFATEFSWLASRPGFRWMFGDRNLNQTWLQQHAASWAAKTRPDSLSGKAARHLSRRVGAHPADEPYAGLSADEARAKYAELFTAWQEKKCGLFMLDPKGDLADFVLRVATMAGREDDVIIVRPGSKWTYNPLLLSENALVMSEFVMDGVKAVAEGEAGPNYWRQVMSEWLTNGLHILKAVVPHKVTFEELLAMARDEQLRTRYVGQAMMMRQEQEQEEARLASLGLSYTGPQVDEGAVRFFKDFDAEDSDPKKRREVIRGLKAYFKFFVERDIRTMLNPPMKPTFRGFKLVPNEGKLVVLHMPFDEYGPVGRVLGILQLMDFQQVMRHRVRADMNRTRICYLLVDEVANYLNPETDKFISMSRQRRVCCIFAHQRLGQLIRGNNQKAEKEFNDNLRTKIIFTAPNADAARSISAMMGSRRTIQKTMTEGLNARGDETNLNEAYRENMSYREVDAVWFPPYEIEGLKNGEAIVKLFDGEKNLDPRKVRAELHYKSQHSAALRPFQDLTETSVAPHPVLHMSSEPQDAEYLRRLMGMNRWFYFQALFTHDGAFGGIRVTARRGTAIIPFECLRDATVIISEGLAQEHTKALFRRPTEAIILGWYVLQIQPQAPVFLDPAYELAGLSPRTIERWTVKFAPRRIQWRSWEFFADRSEGRLKDLGSNARGLTLAYRSLIEALTAADPHYVDLLCEHWRSQAESGLPDLQKQLKTALKHLPKDTPEAQLIGEVFRAAAWMPADPPALTADIDSAHDGPARPATVESGADPAAHAGAAADVWRDDSGADGEGPVPDPDEHDSVAPASEDAAGRGDPRKPGAARATPAEDDLLHLGDA